MPPVPTKPILTVIATSFYQKDSMMGKVLYSATQPLSS